MRQYSSLRTRSVAAGPYLLRAWPRCLCWLRSLAHLRYITYSFAAPRDSNPIAAMPQQIGSYALVRTWNDTLIDGIVVYTRGEYAGILADPAYSRM